MSFIRPDNLRAADGMRHLERDPVEMLLFGVGVAVLAGVLAFKAIMVASAVGAAPAGASPRNDTSAVAADGEISPGSGLREFISDEATDDQDDRSSSSRFARFAYLPQQDASLSWFPGERTTDCFTICTLSLIEAEDVATQTPVTEASSSPGPTG